MTGMTHPASSKVLTYLGVKREIIEHASSLDVAGGRLPSERDWCDLFGVSRTTVRQALQALELEGQIQRKRGSGWYVSGPPLKFDPNDHLPFTYTAIQQGRTPSWREIAIESEIATPEIAADFALGVQRQVLKIQVLLELDGDPVGMETALINPRCCPDSSAIDHQLPISDELSRITESTIRYHRVSIRSSTCGIQAAGLMGVHAESPAMLMRQWIVGGDDMIVAVIDTVWRANALEFVLEKSHGP